MIATHDTFTYCRCTNPVINLLHRWWRCQNLHVTEQIRRGAGYLDVRIRYAGKAAGVVICHGLADMRGMEFDNIFELLAYIEKFKVMYRLILERGDAEDETRFTDIIGNHRERCPNLMWAVIKKGWREVFVREGHPRIADLCLHWDWKTIIKSLFVDVIKKNANKVTVTQSMIDDKNIVYFLDYWKGVNA